MKLTCDLCGSALQINLDGQGATCTACGLIYTMERLREKLNGNTAQQDPPTPKQEDESIYDVQDWSVVTPASGRRCFDYTPEQFVMENSSKGNGDLCGRVLHGGIGLGDCVYLDGDYDHPYRVYTINDDPYMTCAKAGMPAELYLVKCPRKILKNARTVTGAPNPVANAYNYPGTVREYFSHLFAGEFSQYEIRGDVPRKELNIPVNYLFCNKGKPVLAVFLIDSNDSKARYQVKKAARIFASEGVACTHFYENYRNDMPYVMGRVTDVISAGPAHTTKSPAADDSRIHAETPAPKPIVLEVLATKKRLGMAWGTANCRVRQGTVESGQPYYAHINTPNGQSIELGSLKPSNVAEGSEVNMLLYCDKAMLPTIKMLYVFPVDP